MRASRLYITMLRSLVMTAGRPQLANCQTAEYDKLGYVFTRVFGLYIYISRSRYLKIRGNRHEYLLSVGRDTIE